MIILKTTPILPCLISNRQMNPGHSQLHPDESNLDEITRILRAIGNDENSTDALIPLVYEELHRIARIQFSKEYPGHTMQPTALIHEAYLKLLDSNSNNWENRRHFFSAAAEAMRRILVDCARKKNTRKRNSQFGSPRAAHSLRIGAIEVVSISESHTT